jgi:nitrite reductase (NADH) large subunit
MASTPSPTWRCSLCGYVHSGSEPPESCPICGASRDEFEALAAGDAPLSEAGSVSRWHCLACNHWFVGSRPSTTCLVCGADAGSFEAAPEAAPRDSGFSGELVILGAGIAGVSAAEAGRAASPDARITLIAGDPEPPYFRLNLTRYLAGEIARESLSIHPTAWYEQQRITWMGGAVAARLEPDTRRITLSDGRSIRADSVVLASGAHPFIPPLDGTTLDGVFTLRTAADADEILRRVRLGHRCVVIGGGVLGIETAGALAQQGGAVVLLEGHGWLMPRQLNPAAAAVLERHIRSVGVAIVKEARTQALVGDTRLEEVRLQDGRRIPTDLVIFATGVRPNTALARRAGLTVNQGVVVNDRLESSAPGIFAAGDVAEHNGQVYGSWTASHYQGRIAGLNAVGVPTLFGGLPRVHTLTVLGLELTSIGRFTPEDAGDLLLEAAGPDTAYSAFLFRDGRMLGAILIANSSLAAPVRRAIESNVNFSALLQRDPACAAVIRFLRLHRDSVV